MYNNLSRILIRHLLKNNDRNNANIDKKETLLFYYRNIRIRYYIPLTCEIKNKNLHANLLCENMEQFSLTNVKLLNVSLTIAINITRRYLRY